MLRRNIGHLALAVPNNPTRMISLLFLRFILPDEVMEHVLLYPTTYYLVPLDNYLKIMLSRYQVLRVYN